MRGILGGMMKYAIVCEVLKNGGASGRINGYEDLKRRSSFFKICLIREPAENIFCLVQFLTRLFLDSSLTLTLTRASTHIALMLTR